MYQLLKTTILNFVDDEALSRGAAIAFYTVTSLAPVLLLVIAIAGLVFGEDAARGAVLQQLEGLMGRQAAEVLQSALTSASGKSAGVIASLIGAATLLATASGVFGEMQAGLNRIWKAEPKSGTLSRLVRARAASIGLVAALGFLLVVSLAVSAGLTALSGVINARLPFGDILLAIVNFLVSLALLAVLFAAIFKVLPDRAVAWRDVIVGALITAILFTIGRSLIGWYLGSTAVASSYGAAGGLIVLFLWVYYSAQIFLIGAEFTKAYATSRGRGPVVESLTSQPAGRPAPRPGTNTSVRLKELYQATLQPGLSEADRAEREAAYHREALVHNVMILEARLSPKAIGKRMVRAVRKRPVSAAATLGAVTVGGVAIAQALRYLRPTPPALRSTRPVRTGDWL